MPEQGQNEDEEEEEEEEMERDEIIQEDLQGADGNEIDTIDFSELHLATDMTKAAQESWQLFLSSAASREAAGEAIYAALFEGAPSLQSLFTTPRAVQAMRFMNGLASFVMALDEPARLKVLVESLGFGHLNLEVTVPRVVIFRDAIIDLFAVELGNRFTARSREGWMRLLNYVGGAIIFCKAHYAERIKILADSWSTANAGHKDKKAKADDETVVKEEISELVGDNDKVAKTGTDANNSSIGVQNIPTNFADMFMFNAAVMGMGDRLWMNEVLDVFHNIVTNVSNGARLQEEADVLAIRIQKVKDGAVNFHEYKSCMLASLRSLLPKDWTTGHEVAWTWLWDNVERLLTDSEFFKRANILERALNRLLDGLEEPAKYELRKDIYARFFSSTPAGQDFFKQSNTYLHMIADKVLDMSLVFYKEPIKMVDDISALGLRHVGYAIPTEHFPPFVSACIDVLINLKVDKVAIDAFRCSLALVAKMLVRTITEGSTIVMKAINVNSLKSMRKAVACAPRGERSTWMLLVQVGTQSISPLSWSLESGNLEAASAMIKDLLTIRADRDKYYYAVDDLFDRHEDLVKRLIDDAPALLPELFDGLIWRSRLTLNGMRRTNFYLKHLLINPQGKVANCLEWVADAEDPKIVCHPMFMMLTDLVWANATYANFLAGKIWLFFTLTVFICSQAVPQLKRYPVVIFVCRTFVYMCSMNLLIYRHVTKTIKHVQRDDTTKFACFTVPGYLVDWQESCSLALALSLFLMFGLEPILACWHDNGGVEFTDTCSASDALLFPYSFCAMVAMFFYYVLLIDLSVFSNKVSAYILVVGQLSSELALFLLALGVTTLTAASALSCLDHNLKDVSDAVSGSITLIKMFVGWYDAGKFEQLKDSGTVYAVCCVFAIVSVAFLMNLLVAQFTCAYSAIFDDMVGYARLGRLQIIVETLPKVGEKRWRRFIDALKLNEQIEFNEGDLGLAGGIQVLEPANANPTTVDMIRRFGGSTSPSMQWPEDQDKEVDDDDRFERLEKLIQRTMQRVLAEGGTRRNSSGSGKASGSGGNSRDASGMSGIEESTGREAEAEAEEEE